MEKRNACIFWPFANILWWMPGIKFVLKNNHKAELNITQEDYCTALSKSAECKRTNLNLSTLNPVKLWLIFLVQYDTRQVVFFSFLILKVSDGCSIAKTKLSMFSFWHYLTLKKVTKSFISSLAKCEAVFSYHKHKTQHTFRIWKPKNIAM